ncbi:pyridine nucleotide transhydrogenase [Pseudomonas japonica]|uniref:pyridine nucleotide transhydrogenase n=1 Tax=Pseudomonas japonica TaxID=256466 RepID=UPI0015E2A717|nr:pyridine nucleotide transhydrogenase [Pseudomonas japonica]MBA1288773.1 pyridine nucleotide transhydrogenase [Pseudomonas japonica]
MMNALIGYTGFVGSTLTKQSQFSVFYRSTNISDIRDKKFDMVICAGAPAQKWIANRDPEADRSSIEALINSLKTVKCATFVLISTVDVFKNPVGVNEDSSVDEDGLHSYGLHRRMLEKFVEANFENYLIVRLPGLVGPGLRKNIVYDFLNRNSLESIDSRSVYQFYPMVNLWSDIKVALANRLKLVHLTAEPISVSDISYEGFGVPFTQSTVENPPRYDMQTLHASMFGGAGAYQYSLRDTIQAVRHYAQSEPVALQNGADL